MSQPEFWLIAGPNGAGKTTSTRRFLGEEGPWRSGLAEVDILNPDDMTLQLLHAQGIASFAEAPDDILLRTFIAAANETEAELARRLRIGGRVGIETVLSSGKYRGLVEETEKLGGRFRLIYIALSSPEIAVARVASRVMTGGHDVPADKIRNRWKRSLDELPWFLRRASVAWVFDNSLEGAELVATVCSGNATVRGNLFAELARALAAV